MSQTQLKVNSPNVTYTDSHIHSKVVYETTQVNKQGNTYQVTPVRELFSFKTDLRVPKLGVMLVGWGGNNGSTVTAGILANQLNLSWDTKTGPVFANYFGSITQASTVRIGVTPEGEEIYVPFKSLVPLVEPNDLVLDGWDISSLNLADSMARAQVLDYNLQVKLVPVMKDLKPRPSVYFPDFIAANQADRADNVLSGTKQELLEKLREDIRDFKTRKELDKVIVLWTANTERFSEVRAGLNDTAENLMASIQRGESEVSPSTLFAVASILEGCPYINGSPQNTFVPGVLELAIKNRVFVGGDDFKSGQTKLKSVLVDFLVGAGIKPLSIVSYNHLGNNDGRNLSAPEQFRSKEISKTNVVDDMVASNSILYKKGEHPDHVVVIKYAPAVGDSKRAMDEYTSEIFLGGRNTLVIHNTCEDSLLATPLIFDLVILTEFCQRVQFKSEKMSDYDTMHPVLSILSYLLKAPLVPEATPLVNALFKQRACIENLFRACIGLSPESNMLLEHKIAPQAKISKETAALR